VVKNRVVGNLSGGACSWAAIKLQAMDSGTANLTCLFADTLIEDDDLYRFLIDTAANIYGVERPHLPGLANIPPLKEMAARKEHLTRLRAEAMDVLPGLVWIAEGRTPWEVYRDERFIGNSLADPCSKILKRQLLDRWMNENCPRPTTPRVVGLGQWERERFEGQYVTLKGKKTWKPGLAERMAAKGWAFRAPLIYWRPAMDRTDIYAWLDREGIDPPALSEEGFATNNCGGFCCKMGLRQAQRLYHHRPETFAYSAEQERLSQEHIGTECTVLRREEAGRRVPLSLRRFGEELSAGVAGTLFPSHPACGCFTDGSDE
jgi:hypothetical protein